ncbi:MAG: ABC transporter [Rhodospirillaceae bacterium]|nr:ABC transporter [Rhodospirillaceae bacterium]
MDEAVVPILTLNEVTKAFPGVVANDSIDIRVMPGQIHALLGENGAGKSTLVQILYGMLRPDAGTVFWNGHPVKIYGPAEARNLGIGMVFQHFSLFEAMTVLENVALALNEERDMAKIRKRVIEVSHGYGLPLDPDRYVHSLSVGERQRIEIVRCLLQDPKLLILDEPTSVLTPQETEKLFKTLRKLASEGCAILYISHKLREVKTLCETATILRAGRVVANCDPREETAQSLAELMIGQRISSTSRAARENSGGDRIRVTNLSMKPEDEFGIALDDISLTVKRGEVLGVAGVAGNGQKELMAAMSGEARPMEQPDAIWFDGVPVAALGPAARRALGAVFVPEERNGHSAVRDMTLSENAFLTAARRMKLMIRGLMCRSSIRKFAGDVVSRFDVRTTGVTAQAGSLSGGNLQKFIVGREILQDPGIMVISQPTWGVDAGAAVTIRQALLNLAHRGCAILLISQDLDEIFEVCDRIVVIAKGRVSGAREIESVSVDEVGLLMGGFGVVEVNTGMVARRAHDD